MINIYSDLRKASRIEVKNHNPSSGEVMLIVHLLKDFPNHHLGIQSIVMITLSKTGQGMPLTKTMQINIFYNILGAMLYVKHRTCILLLHPQK